MSERYDPLEWENTPSQATPINEDNLNHMETGISDVDDFLSWTQATVGYLQKNLIPYPFDTASRTVNGLTFTVHDDGTVTVNGTATATTYFYLHTNETQNTPFSLPKGEYILSGAPVESGAGKYGLEVGRDSGGTFTSIGYDYGDGLSFQMASDTSGIEVRIFASQGQTITNQVFYPMIRHSYIKDASYDSYIANVSERLNKIEAQLKQIFG